MQTSLVKHQVGSAIIGQRVADGYLNATALCQACGKDWHEYWSNKGTQEFLHELASQEGVPVKSDGKPGIPGLVYSVRGGAPGRAGTWVHPDVAVHLAQWLDPKFAVKVSRWVREWMTVGKTPTRLPVYTTRLSLAYRMQMGVPDGYWTVFDKCSNLLILVEVDLQLPVEKFDLLDGSVGIHWSRFRQGKPWMKDSIKYDHLFPDIRGVKQANGYHVDELPHFERWMRNAYQSTHLPAYLDSKYTLPLPARTLIARTLKYLPRDN